MEMRRDLWFRCIFLFFLKSENHRHTCDLSKQKLHLLLDFRKKSGNRFRLPDLKLMWLHRLFGFFDRYIISYFQTDIQVSFLFRIRT